MTAVLVFAKVALKAIAENWKVVLAVGCIAVCTWVFFDWRGQAAEIDDLRSRLRASAELTDKWRGVAELQSAAAKDAAERREAAEKKLKELLGRPPKIVTVYEQAAADAPTIIHDDATCEEAVRQIAEFVSGVGGGP